MLCLFFFNDTATTEIYTLSLHDALPICGSPSNLASWPSLRNSSSRRSACMKGFQAAAILALFRSSDRSLSSSRSEEHTSELQSRQYLVCRLLLEKKNQPLTLLEDERPRS